MVERKILYYPTILVPSRWLKWAILYWDKASSIIPTRWEENLAFMNSQEKESYKDMRYLWKEAELFEPTRPEIWSESGDRRKKMSAHKRLLIELKSLLNQNLLKSVNKDWAKNPRCRIHSDKFSRHTFDLLNKLRLIKPNHQSNWIFVEEKTFLLYMALLAKNLADADIDYTVSSTNWPEYETIVFESNDEDNGFLSLRTRFLDILPVPRDNVPIKEIVKFRKEKRNELLDFREILDTFQKEISCAKNQVEVKQISLQYKERIEKERAKLKDSMRDSNIKTTSSIFASLIDIKSPALIETIGFSLTKMPPEISVPIIVGTAAIQIGCAWIDKRNEQTAKTRETPFSYLYEATQRKII